MAQLFRLLAAKLRGDRRGSVAVTFGLSFIPVALITGAAIDYSRSSTQWSNLQQATDATALSAAHTFLSSSSTSATLKTYAQSYISGLMNGATVTSVSLALTNTQICVYTSYNVPTVFMKIANINNIPVSTSACSQVAGTAEVALALDNSGSMSESAGNQSKIQALQAAALQLVSTLIPSGTPAPQAPISIDPFTSMVNVGTSTTAPFLDTAGASSIHWQNFHRPTGSGLYTPTSKFDLFTTTSTTWAGCVEERPVPYTTTDTAASASTPDTMFVPYFAPDEPGPVDNSSGYACYPTGSNNCDRTVPPYIFSNSYIADSGASSSGNCAQANDNADTVTTYSGDGQTNVYPGSGITEVCKYKNTSISSKASYFGIATGPNYMCASQQLTPLTTSTSVLNSAIN